MNMIQSYSHLVDVLRQQPLTLLLIVKSGSTQCECASKNLSEAAAAEQFQHVYGVDVVHVKDVHSRFGVDTVPTLLVFKGEQVRSVIKGCHDVRYYRTIISDSQFFISSEGKKQKNVTIYTTPTCTWCNTLKSWLRRHGIYYTEIDVSHDLSAAEELVSRTGQQGVPQTEIDGQWVVGFNEKRLKELLEIEH